MRTEVGPGQTWTDLDTKKKWSVHRGKQQGSDSQNVKVNDAAGVRRHRTAVCAPVMCRARPQLNIFAPVRRKKAAGASEKGWRVDRGAPRSEKVSGYSFEDVHKGLWCASVAMGWTSNWVVMA